MRAVIRPVASLEELVQAFDLLGAQLPPPLTHHDRRLGELAGRFPADRPLMLLAEDQGRILGGALAFRTGPASPAGGVTLRLVAVTPAHRGRGLGRRLLQEVETAAIRLGAVEVSLGASGAERGFYLHRGTAAGPGCANSSPAHRARAAGQRRRGAATWPSCGSTATGASPAASRDTPAAGRGDRPG